MTRPFLNIHVLYTLTGANPNRDDTGTPKSLRSGGVERSRLSSQAMTRAKRIGYESDPDGERSFRSALLPRAIYSRTLDIIGKDDDATKGAVAKHAFKAVYDLTLGKDKSAKKAEHDARLLLADETPGDAAGADDEDLAGSTLVWLAEAEIEAAAQRIASNLDQDTNPEDFLDPDNTASLAIAAFGRMFAQRPDLQREAAIQRASAFTTHAVAVDLDYFTAMDDLRTVDKGAGHMNLKQHTGGVYYWHANIDRNQLLSTWDVESVEDPDKRVSALVRHLLIDLPRGAQSTTAHHALPAYVLVVEADSPVSLQTAFESPVQPREGGGYLTGSIVALEEEHGRAERFAPELFGTTLRTGTHANPGLALSEAADAVARWVLDGNLAP